MDHASALRIAQRFIALPVDKRRQYLAKMAEQKVSPGNLPIPVIREQLDSLPLSFAQERQWFLWQLGLSHPYRPAPARPPRHPGLAAGVRCPGGTPRDPAHHLRGGG